jgi:hypothetical protein
MRKSRREVTRKVVRPRALEAAVPAAKRRVLPKEQATRLPPQLLLRRGYDLAKKLPTFTAAFPRTIFGMRDPPVESPRTDRA